MEREKINNNSFKTKDGVVLGDDLDKSLSLPLHNVLLLFFFIHF